MITSEKVEAIAEALAAAQKEYGAAVKDSANPYFKSKYADLSSVLGACGEPLNAHGIAVVQDASAEGKAVTVTTRLQHSSGQYIEGKLTLVAKDDSPQSVGSAITYARRYGLMAMAGIAPEDDDGEAAQPRGGPVVKKVEEKATNPAGANKTLRAGALVKAIKAKHGSPDDFAGFITQTLGVRKAVSECSDEELTKLENAVNQK